MASRSILPSAIPLGSCIGGVPIKLHLSFFLLLAIQFFNAIRPRYRDYPALILFEILVYGPILFVTVLTHEMGHVMMNRRCGGESGEIYLWPLGGFAVCGPTDDLKGDLKTSLAGPLTHIPMGLFWWILYVATKGADKALWPSWAVNLVYMTSGGARTFVEVLSAYVVYLNLVLFCFNLLIPAYPLDGGRVFGSSLILFLGMNNRKAAKVTAGTAMLIGFGMIAYALATLLMREAGGQLLLGFIGVFIFYQSWELWLKAKNDDLGNDPIFGRQCYQDGETSANATAATEMGTAAQQADEREII